MEATLNPLAKAPFEIKGNTNNATTSAFKTLVEKFNKLEADGIIDQDSCNNILIELHKVYLDRLAEQYVDRKLMRLVKLVNLTLCRTIIPYVDPHKSHEHINLNYKSKELRILSYDK